MKMFERRASWWRRLLCSLMEEHKYTRIEYHFICMNCGDNIHCN